MTKNITRREFLKLSAVSIGAAVLAGCQNPRRYVTLEPYVKAPEEQLTGQATWYASTCRICPAGCGILVRVMNGRALKIEGNPEHPLNQGKLCPRGQAGLQLLYNPDRLQGPVRQGQKGSRQYQRISWEEGLNTLYGMLSDSGSGTAILCGSTTSGHLFDLFSRFSTAVGAPAPVVVDLFTQINGYPTLSKASQAFGGPAVPPAFDISGADLLLSFGANFLESWVSDTRYGIDYGKFRLQPGGIRGYLIQLEPRMSMTAAKADEWYAIVPGTEGIVAQAIAATISQSGLVTGDAAAKAQALAAGMDPGHAAEVSGLPLSTIQMLANRFAAARHPVAIPGSNLAVQQGGLDAVTAIIGLSNLSGGVTFQAPAPTNTILHAEGTDAASLQQLISSMQGGSVKTLLIYDTNPVYMLPPALGFAEALKNVANVVSFGPLIDETAVWADLVLPDHTYLEAWGYEAVTPNFGTPVVGSQQPVVMPVYDTRSTADVLLTAARGVSAASSAFTWQDEVAFLQETIGKLPAGTSGGGSPDVIWSRFLQHGGWWQTPGENASQSAAAGSTQPATIPDPVYQGDQGQYPYLLQMYMTSYLGDGSYADLRWLQGAPDPMTTIAWQTWVQIHPETAAKLDVKDSDIVTIESANGKIEAVVYTYPAIRPDTVAVPMGQGHTDFGRDALLRGGNAVQLAGGQADSASGGLIWSGMRVKITGTGKKKKLALLENREGSFIGIISSNPAQ